MKRKLTKKWLTMIVVLALLFLLIPAGVLFADSASGGSNSQQTETFGSTEQTSETEELGDEEEEEGDVGNENSAAVAERIAAAEALGIPPGHLNLIDRLAAISGITREEALLLWQEAPVQSLMQEIQRLKFEQKGKEFPGNPQNGKQTEEETLASEQGSTRASHGKGNANGHNK